MMAVRMVLRRDCSSEPPEMICAMLAMTWRQDCVPVSSWLGSLYGHLIRGIVYTTFSGIADSMLDRWRGNRFEPLQLRGSVGR